MSHDNEMHEISPEALNRIGLGQQFSRREFLLISGVMVVAVSALEARAAKEAPLIIMDQAKGLVIADPTKCVGCRRCELACTEFNDGKASPTIARIKISSKPQFWTKRPSYRATRPRHLGKRVGHPGSLQTMSPSCALRERLSE